MELVIEFYLGTDKDFFSSTCATVLPALTIKHSIDNTNKDSKQVQTLIRILNQTK